MAKKEASDLHLKPMRPPLLRIKGKLIPLNTEPLQPKDLEDMLREILTPAQLHRLEQNQSVDLGYGLHGVGLSLIASDVVRYRPLVILSALGYLAFGIVFLFIDTGLGMPALWVVGNNGSAMLVGALLLGLVWAQWRHEMRL